MIDWTLEIERGRISHRSGVYAPLAASGIDALVLPRQDTLTTLARDADDLADEARRIYAAFVSRRH